MANKRIYKSYKMKKTKVVPVFLLMLFLTIVILFNQFCLKKAVNAYMINNRIHDGHLAADRIYEQFRNFDVSDSEAVSRYYDLYVGHDRQLRGIEIKDGDQSLFSRGETMPDEVTYFTGEKFGIHESLYPIALSSEKNNSMVRGRNANYDLEFGLTPWKRDNIQIYENGHLVNQPDDYQDIWYSEEVNGYTVIIGYAVPFAWYDYQLCIVFSLFFVSVVFLVVAIAAELLTRIVRTQNKMVRVYYEDKITGGYNWYYFITYANRRLRHINANKKKTNSAIIMLHMVRFGTFCSCNGEEAGNRLLRDIHSALKKELPKKGILARHDRADFALFIPFESDEELLRRGHDILNRLEALRPEMKLIFKAGIYMVDPEDKLDAADAYLRAEIACDKIENAQDEHILLFNQAMRDNIQWDSKMENDLERGLANHEFEVYLQPKHSCSDEKLAAAEALVRWNHPTEGFLTPYKFIPVFERTGLIGKLDDYMISNVARIQAEFLEKGVKTIPISVNLSRTNFTRSDLAEHISSLVDVYKVPHELIEIELTESSFFDDQELIIATAQKLRDSGFEVSLDDFGAGYSSLNSLRNIPIDIVKLDAGFFRGVDADGKGDIIVNEIIRLAKQLDIKIVAEGIEEKAQVDFLRTAGCDLIQGYYYAKPMPVTEYERQYL